MKNKYRIFKGAVFLMMIGVFTYGVYIMQIWENEKAKEREIELEEMYQSTIDDVAKKVSKVLVKNDVGEVEMTISQEDEVIAIVDVFRKAISYPINAIFAGVGTPDLMFVDDAGKELANYKNDDVFIANGNKIKIYYLSNSEINRIIRKYYGYEY